MEIKQNTPEWLELRKTKIGASDAPVIMGQSPWKTPLQLWEEKLGLKNAQISSMAMKRGVELEPLALAKFCSTTGLEMRNRVVIHKRHNWMMASMDGLTEDGKIGVEIKCPGPKDHELALDGVVPEKYIPQLQHQMYVCELSMIYYFSFSEKSTKVIEVERNDRFLDTLLKEEEAFWNCMQTFDPPKTTDRDYEFRDDYDWKMIASEWKDNQAALKALEAKEEMLRKQLIGLAGTSNCQGAGVRVLKSMRKGNVDYKAIPELKSLDVEQYRKPPVASWRLTAY